MIKGPRCRQVPAPLISEPRGAEPEGQGEPLRLILGGSWLGHARLVRKAYRSWDGPDVRAVVLGFRCARGPVDWRLAGGQGGLGVFGSRTSRDCGARKGLDMACRLRFS